MKLTQLTEAELNRALEGTKTSDQNRKIAHAVFVERRKQIEVAEAFGVTRENVGRVTRAVTAAIEKTVSDTAWVRMEMELPKGIADELELLIKTLREIRNKDRSKAFQRAVGIALMKERSKIVKEEESLQK